MRSLELKIPPLLLVLICGALMWFASHHANQFAFHFQFQRPAAATLAVGGLIIAAFGAAEFRRAKTTVNPTKPESSSTLVNSGIYKHTRNPMYLGFLLILCGWAVRLGNMIAFLFLPAFVIYMNRFQIEPEERALESIFGAPFKTYCSKIRRWI
jgi:protein-S-isoprenylcysteine O-methyltransferase Ste14